MQQLNQSDYIRPTASIYHIILWGNLLLCLSLQAGANESTVLKVFVSIAPQKYWVERIGGKHVDVQVMLSPGQNPETYEPTPETMLSLVQADIYFRINVPFEKLWITRLARDNPRLNVVACCPQQTASDHHPNAHLGTSHLWTSPQQVLDLLALMHHTLVQHDPAHTAHYSMRYKKLQQELIILHQEISEILQPVSGRAFIVNHPAWQEFANDYQLTQLAIEENHDAVRAKDMIELITIAQAQGIKRVFFQRQFNQSALQSIAAQIDAEIVELDPLAADYINNMRYTAQLIADSFRIP